MGWRVNKRHVSLETQYPLLMKIFPTKDQWQNWSLPSKITYIGFVLTILSISITLVTFYFSNKYVKESDQPKLSINFTNKPYLRYEVKNKGIELSYELRIKNDGKNTAEDIEYSLLKQKLAVDMRIIGEVNSSLNPRAPQRLITQNSYHQIIKARNSDMSASQIERVIND
ncbi:MAG: hypothetical protein Q8N14_02700, partial [Candidatus Omnitrophota bacterium]|nr:hypothetical protein [Candidatus Omnitrophota bacterium]